MAIYTCIFTMAGLQDFIGGTGKHEPLMLLNPYCGRKSDPFNLGGTFTLVVRRLGRDGPDSDTFALGHS